MTEIKTGYAINHVPAARLAYSALIAVLVAFGLYAAFISGPAIRADAREALGRTIADENLAFCEKFGMEVGTSAFAACSQELATIRQKQTDRNGAAAPGIL